MKKVLLLIVLAFAITGCSEELANQISNATGGGSSNGCNFTFTNDTDYGSVAVGSSAIQTRTIAVTCTTPTTINATVTGDTNDFILSTSSEYVTLMPKLFTLDFKPMSPGGKSLTLSLSGGGASYTKTFAGIGVNPTPAP